jgi:hypothetical protein
LTSVVFVSAMKVWASGRVVRAIIGTALQFDSSRDYIGKVNRLYVAGRLFKIGT